MAKCSNCGKVGGKENEVQKICTRCRNAWYCDRECQRKDWQYHRRTCRAAAKETTSPDEEPEGMSYERMKAEKGAQGLALVITDESHREEDIKKMQRWLNANCPIEKIAITTGSGIVRATQIAGVDHVSVALFVGVTDNAAEPTDAALLTRMSGFDVAADFEKADMMIYRNSTAL